MADRAPLRPAGVLFALLFIALGCVGVWLASGHGLPALLTLRGLPLLLIVLGVLGLLLSRPRQRKN